VSAPIAPIVTPAVKHAAPNRIPATFRHGSLDGTWTYLLDAPPTYDSPTGERYTVREIVWHSEQDRVMSHVVYLLSPVLFRKGGAH